MLLSKLELDAALNDMDVPLQRVNDIHWLQRNLGVRNHTHPFFDDVMETLAYDPQGKLCQNCGEFDPDHLADECPNIVNIFRDVNE
jgi:hypothetical protein